MMGEKYDYNNEHSNQKSTNDSKYTSSDYN